jgi:predicted dehydrogenase
MRNAAVIGCGKFGYFHAEKYSNMKNINLVGIADIDIDRGKMVADHFGCSYSDNYKSFSNVDLVSIVTPNILQYDIAKYFIECGADVLIEKPMTESSLALQDLMGRARFKGVRLWGGFLERYNSVFKEVAQERHIEELYTHRSCAYRECREDEDVVFDLMIHDIFLVLMLIGSSAKDMEVEKGNSLSNCNDFVRAKIEFENGLKADLTARRDIKEKTKVFAVKTKSHPWKVYNLKRKGNDTLEEELREFAEVGWRFEIDLALKSMQLAERILR